MITWRKVALSLSCGVLSVLLIVGAGTKDYRRSAIYERLHASVPVDVTRAAGELDLSNGGYFVARDFHSEQVNIEHHERRTLGTPAHYASTLWMFGSSSLTSLNVSDAETIPSLIQRQLSDVRVVNLAAEAHTVIQMAARLRDIPIRPGDSVVFYIGLMEAYDAAEMANRDSWLCPNLLEAWLARLACPSLGPEAEAAIVRAAAEGYGTILKRARLDAKRRGASFTLVLQPSLFSRPLSAYEQLIARSTSVSIRDLYPLMWRALVPFVDLDLTHVLDEARASGEEFYIDAGHVDGRANAEIAAAMLPIVRSTVRERCTALF